MDPDDDVLASLRRPLPPGFRRWRVVVAPGAALPYDATQWRGAIVAVEGGAIELVCRAGSATRLTAGALLHLADLPLHELRNPGAEPAVLLAVTRRDDAGLA